MTNRRLAQKKDVETSDETAALSRAVDVAGRMPKVANGAVLQALWAILVKETDPGEAKGACKRYQSEIDAFSEYFKALREGDEKLGISKTLAARIDEKLWSDQKALAPITSFIDQAYAINEQLSQPDGTESEAARKLAELASGPLSHALDACTKEIGELLAETSREADKVASATRKLTEETVVNLKDLTVRIQLIAVNASVEAARVGQAGAGFGVIAHEITTLSQNAQSAVEQISKGLAGAQA